MQIDELATKLQALGLDDKQSRVAVAGILLGPAPASKISEQAHISRPSTYYILAELEELGLAQRSDQDGITLFTVVDYAGLLAWFDRRQSALANQRQLLVGMRDEVQSLTREVPAHQPRVRFVEGQAGIDSINDEALRKAKPGTVIYAVTNHDETLVRYPDHLSTNPVRRLKKRLRSQQFYYNSRAVVASDPALLKETTRLDEPPRGDITLYEDRAILLSYEGDWSGVVIESPAIVHSLRQLFERAWGHKILSK